MHRLRGSLLRELLALDLSALSKRNLFLVIEQACAVGNGRLYQVACQAIERSNLNSLSFAQVIRLVRLLVDKSMHWHGNPGSTDLQTLYHILRLNEQSILNPSTVKELD